MQRLQLDTYHRKGRRATEHLPKAPRTGAAMLRILQLFAVTFMILGLAIKTRKMPW
jgi:hypothetical protein